jgi:DNA-binding PadR family transcriptional regulator
MRERGLVDALSVGESQRSGTPVAAYWRLTEAGREKLARLRGL